MLVGAGAAVDIKDKDGSTLLHYAIRDAADDKKRIDAIEF